MRWKLVLRIVGILFLLMQFVRPDRANPEFDPAGELQAVASVPGAVSTLLRTACYDCHSYETVWPWYAHVAPASWFLTRHVNEGRRHLNFSDWGNYPPSRADHKLEEVIEMVEEGEMPLSSYVPLHPEAKLSGDDRAAIVEWARGLRAEMGVAGGDEDEH